MLPLCKNTQLIINFFSQYLGFMTWFFLSNILLIQLNPLKYTIIKLLWQIQFKLVTCSVHLKLHNSSKSLHDSEVLTNPQQDIPGCGRDSWSQGRKTEHLSENSSGCTEAGQSHKVMKVRYKRMTNCYLHISAAMENVLV